MPAKRIKYEGIANYHVTLRVTGQEFLLDTKTKDEMRKDLGKAAGFSGAIVLTYALMDNHIHLLVRIGGKCTADEKELLRRYKILYGERRAHSLAKRWEHLRKLKKMRTVKKEKYNLRKRMNDLSKFMKLLGQLWSQHYNKRTGRKGTLWATTFHSVLVDPDRLVYTGAYIDMNAVRANITDSPENYPWCGFAEAMGKSLRVIDELDFKQGLIEMYRKHSDEVPGNQLIMEHLNRFFRIGKDLLKFPKECWDENGILRQDVDLPITLCLRCRIGYFTRGCIIGSKEFVNWAFHEFREFFGSRRKTGARKIHGSSELAELLYSARDLRKDVICRSRKDIIPHSSRDLAYCLPEDIVIPPGPP